MLDDSGAARQAEIAEPSALTTARLTRAIWVGSVVLLIALIITIAVALGSGVDLRSLLHFGYPGISLIMFFSSATVLLPAPGFASVLAAGAFANPILVGVFAGAGSAVGELTGYLVGLSSRKAIAPKEGTWLGRAEWWMRRYGFLTILVFASIPNPFFDAIGLLAGSLAYPARRVFVACVIGNTVKYTTLALLGGAAVSFFID